MPHRPPKKQKKTNKRYVPGSVVLKAEEAVAFLKDQLLFHTMLEKRERVLSDAEPGFETITVSIGSPVRYNKATYLAHIYCIDNFENPALNGWIVHLWYPGLVMGRHPTYRSYMTQMSNDLGLDLWSVGV
jgi:hypothetical protein